MASTPPAPGPDAARCVTLDTGLQLVTVPLPHARTSFVTWVVRVGQRDEPENQAGITYLLNHMKSRTSPTRPEARTQLGHLSRMGALWRADTGYDQSNFELEVRPHHLLEAIDALWEMAAGCALGTLEIERAVVIGKLPRSHSPDVYEQALSAIWPGNPIGLPVSSTRERLARLSAADLEAHQARHYTTGNSVVVVAGRFDEAEVREQVARRFAALPTGTRPPRQPIPAPAPARLHGLVIPSSHTEVLATFPFSTPDQTFCGTTEVLSEIVIYRFWHQLRAQRGLFSGSCGTMDFDEANLPWVSLHVETANLTSELLELGRSLCELGRSGPSEDELEQAREIMLTRAVKQWDHPALVGQIFARSQLAASPSIDDYCQRVERCSSADVRAAAQRCFDPGALHLLLQGPAEEGAHEVAHRRLVEALGGRGPKGRLSLVTRA